MTPARLALARAGLRAAIVGAMLLAAACAGNPGPGTPVTRDPDVINAAELEELGSVPVRRAIERLRPGFLRTRGASSMNRAADRLVVYLGTTRMGGPEILDQVMTSAVSEIRYLNGPDATQRYGIDHAGGAIVLVPR